MVNQNREIERWETEIIKAHAAIEQGNFEEADGLFQYAMGEANCFGDHDPRVGHVYGQIAVLHSKRREHDKALACLDKAIEIFKKHVQNHQEVYATLLASKGSVLEILNRREEAIQVLGEAIDNAKDPVDLGNYIAARAVLKKESGNLSDSIKDFRQCLEVREKHYGKDSPELIDLLELIRNLIFKSEPREAELIDKRIGGLQKIQREALNNPDSAQNIDWRFTKYDVLDILSIQEQESYQRTREYFGKTCWQIQRIASLYDHLGILFNETKASWPEERLYAFTCFLHGCRYQLLMAALTLFRGHRTDSATYIRKAIEFFTFGSLIARNTRTKREKCSCGKPIEQSEKSKEEKELAYYWLHAVDNNRSFNRYKSRFEIMIALKMTSDLAPTLLKTYEELSKQVHPTFVSVAGHTKVIKKENELIHLFEYFENRGDNKMRLAGLALFWLIGVHEEILKGFAKLLEETTPAFKQDKWEELLKQFQQELLEDKRRSQPVLDPDGKLKAELEAKKKK